MRIAIVFNHPYEGSFCNAMLQAVTRGLGEAGHEVDLLHLDRDGFNKFSGCKNLVENGCLHVNAYKKANETNNGFDRLVCSDAEDC